MVVGAIKQKLNNELKKLVNEKKEMFELLLDIDVDKINKDLRNDVPDRIEILQHSETSYNYFYQNFIVKNVPCIIKNISFNWECSSKWVDSESNKINIDYLTSKYGNLLAPVADCNVTSFNSHCKTEMKVGDYMEYLLSSERKELLYLKDWHLKRLQPNDTFYEVPAIFASDWLNEYAQDHQEDDFMFVYIGPKDTWTPLHTDVFCSYSWSVNVVGRKEWILFPPGEEKHLKDNFGNLPLHFNSELYSNIKYFTLIQEKGDALFVPSGWHHEVTNLLDTISVNHNWINACNLDFVWEALQKNLVSVEKEIREFEDTPEFFSQCQLILKSVFGMDFAAFINFIQEIANKRIEQLQSKDSTNSSDINKYYFGVKHLLFDLNSILKIMKSIENHHLFNKLSDIKNDFLNVKKCIESTLQNK